MTEETINEIGRYGSYFDKTLFGKNMKTDNESINRDYARQFPTHTCGCACGHTNTALNTLVTFLTITIMADLNEIQSKLNAVLPQLTKIRNENSTLRVELAAANAAEAARNVELLAKVAELEALVAAGGGTPEQIAAISTSVDTIKTFLEAFDADVADPAVTPA